MTSLKNLLKNDPYHAPCHGPHPVGVLQAGHELQGLAKGRQVAVLKDVCPEDQDV